MGWVALFFVLFLLCIIQYCRASLSEHNCTLRISDENKTLISATGKNVNEALAALFSKLERRIDETSNPEMVASLIRKGEIALADVYKKASRRTRESCENTLVIARRKHKRLLDERMQKQEAAIKESAEKRKVEVKKKQEKERSMSSQKSMAAEQRRLMTPSLRYRVLSRDGYRCKICGASASDGVQLHVDHIFPVSKGGKTELSNLQTLCNRCNLGKGDQIMTAPIPVSSFTKDSASVSTSPSVSFSLHPTSEQEYIDLTPEEFMRLLSSSAECTQDECTPQTAYTTDELIEQLSKQGIKYLDKRNQGGCLWIEMTKTSEQLLDSVTVDGKPVYRASSAKAFSKAPAFFIK